MGNDGNRIESRGRPAIMENILDITEEKAEESIRLLSDAVERATDVIIITDLEGNITFANDSCAKICGYDKSELIGRHISLIHYASRHDASFKNSLASLKETGACPGEITVREKTEEAFLVILSVSIIKDKSGTPIAMLVIGRDRLPEDEGPGRVFDQAF